MNNESIKIGLPSRERKFASSFEESQTIQDDALSLREILVRFSSGQPLPSVVNNQEGFPLGDMEHSDFSFGDTSDLVDVDNIKASTSSILSRVLEDSTQVQQNNSNDDKSGINSNNPDSLNDISNNNQNQNNNE